MLAGRDFLRIVRGSGSLEFRRCGRSVVLKNCGEFFFVACEMSSFEDEVVKTVIAIAT